jgi:probable rRNA maturation factor
MGAGAVDVHVEFANEQWQTSDIPDAAAMITRAVEAAMQAGASGGVPSRQLEIGVRLTDDRGIQDLNRDWRGQDKPTNVLAFALEDDAAGLTGAEASVLPLGDIVVAFETCAREAQDDGKTMTHHLCHLVVHGTLHLLGYDHDKADDAEIMEAAEREILAGLGVPDPYANSVAA